ncbi:hypothetical protein G6F31_014826 [Rhizopus arrhizus]|nr:hypothetical protein G6F31_014826 [Rhizopus arrhizus]
MVACAVDVDQVDVLFVDQAAQRALLGQLLRQGRQAAAEVDRQRAGNAFIGHGTQQAAVGWGCNVERVPAMQGPRKGNDVRRMAATVAVVEVGVQDFHGGDLRATRGQCDTGRSGPFRRRRRIGHRLAVAQHPQHDGLLPHVVGTHIGVDQAVPAVAEATAEQEATPESPGRSQHQLAERGALAACKLVLGHHPGVLLGLRQLLLQRAVRVVDQVPVQGADAAVNAGRLVDLALAAPATAAAVEQAHHPIRRGRRSRRRGPVRWPRAVPG